MEITCLFLLNFGVGVSVNRNFLLAIFLQGHSLVLWLSGDWLGLGRLLSLLSGLGLLIVLLVAWLLSLTLELVFSSAPVALSGTTARFSSLITLQSVKFPTQPTLTVVRGSPDFLSERPPRPRPRPPPRRGRSPSARSGAPSSPS